MARQIWLVLPQNDGMTSQCRFPKLENIHHPRYCVTSSMISSALLWLCDERQLVVVVRIWGADCFEKLSWNDEMIS